MDYPGTPQNINVMHLTTFIQIIYLDFQDPSKFAAAAATAAPAAAEAPKEEPKKVEEEEEESDEDFGMGLFD